MFESQDTSSLTSLKLAALATSLLPKKHFTGFQEIEDGFDDYHSVLLIDSENEQYILRTPSRETATGKFAAEVRILKELQGEFAVPELLAFDNRIAIFKTFRGKAYAPGVLTSAQVKHLAEALAKLHSLPFSIVDKLGLPSFTNQQQQAILLGVLYEVALLGRVPGSLLSRFEQFLEDGTMWGYDSVVINADLRPRNVIFDGDEISCILSWSTLQGQDPAYDLAGIVPALDSSARETFLNAYRKTRAKYGVNVALDANLDRRAEFYAQFELVTKLLLAKAAGNEEEMDKVTAELERADERLTLADELKAVESDTQKKLQEREAELAKQDLQDNLLTERVEIMQNASRALKTGVQTGAQSDSGGEPNSQPTKESRRANNTSETPAIIARIPDDILSSSPSLKTISDENASDIELELRNMLTPSTASVSEDSSEKSGKSVKKESAGKETASKDTGKDTVGAAPFRIDDYITDDIKKAISESEAE